MALSALVVETTSYAQCPVDGCDGRFIVMPHPQHRIGERYTWICDSCGTSIHVTPRGEGMVETSADEHAPRWSWQYVLLEIPPDSPPVRFVLKTKRPPGDDAEERARYFYDEHTCPTNWLRHVQRVEVDGDQDPHGFARFVRMWDVDADELGELLRPDAGRGRRR